MRLPDERIAHLALRAALALIAVPALAGCGMFGGSDRDLASAPPAPSRIAVNNGPAADYPIVIGNPYRVGATLYTPADTMNYDEVGYVSADAGAGVSGSHHTLPLPSYVEVTSLETGKTILVRLERRGPMSGDAVVALSPAALAQLGASAGTPVRVRRVNAPEEERAMLRAGRSAPPRMDTPASLVAVLKRKLPAEGSVALAAKASPQPAALAAVELPPSAASPRPAVEQASVALSPTRRRGAPPPLPPLPTRISQSAPVVQPTPLPATPPREKIAVNDGVYVVQAAAMSTLERAKLVAGSIGGSVTKAGQLYRVRTGPFATRAQAEASLAKVRSAGYSDARIQTNG